MRSVPHWQNPYKPLITSVWLELCREARCKSTLNHFRIPTISMVHQQCKSKIICIFVIAEKWRLKGIFKDIKVINITLICQMSILYYSFFVSKHSSAQPQPTTPLWCIEKGIHWDCLIIFCLKVASTTYCTFLSRCQACDHYFTHPKRFKHDSNSF